MVWRITLCLKLCCIFGAKKRGDGVRAAPAAQQIESGINVTTHQKKHGPSISANFSFTVKEEKLASSRSINLIIFVIDRCLWRPSKAQKDEKLISIFKSAAFGHGRLQWGDDKKCFPGAALCRSNSPPLLHVAALPCPCWYLVDKTRSACRLDHYRLMRNIPWE